MWLLNVTTLALKHFEGILPEYGILSHRWDVQEVSFRDLKEGFLPAQLNLQGYNKVSRCCLQADRDGLEWVWIDTCCIDKSSSAELSEAINSMFRYYRDAAICYAFLSDINMTARQDLNHFVTSAWFTRGWTLQELLAPRELRFYDRNWVYIGSKADGTISNAIDNVTSIPTRALKEFNPQDWSVADRMSWASRRETTREEDLAYCLLGIFDVNMVPIYGEGSKAFFRLQQEITGCNMDRSIFLWHGNSASHCSMLARSPACFSHPDRTSMYLLLSSMDNAEQADFNWVTTGLRLKVKLVPFFERYALAYLGQRPDQQCLWIVVVESGIVGLYQRISVNRRNYMLTSSSCYVPDQVVTIGRTPLVDVNIPKNAYELDAFEKMLERLRQA